MVLNLLLQSRMPVVLARLRTESQIDGNLGWNKEKNCLRMKESVGRTSSRLTIRLLNIKSRVVKPFQITVPVQV